MKTKNVIIILLASFITTAILVIITGFYTAYEQGYVRLFDKFALIHNQINSDGTFTISYTVNVIYLFIICLIFYSIISVISTKLGYNK